MCGGGGGGALCAKGWHKVKDMLVYYLVTLGIGGK